VGRERRGFAPICWCACDDDIEATFLHFFYHSRTLPFRLVVHIGHPKLI